MSYVLGKWKEECAVKNESYNTANKMKPYKYSRIANSFNRFLWIPTSWSYSKIFISSWRNGAECPISWRRRGKGNNMKIGPVPEYVKRHRRWGK